MSFANNSKNLGHAVSNDLNQWTVLDTAAISVRPGQFDSQHVWAPTIVKRGLTYTMFYTGVDDAQDQRIGFATSSDLINWVQGTTVLSASQVAWADANPPSPYNGQQQFRDPYVMPHPTQPGQWLMYFVTTPTAYSPGMVVGVARSTGNFSAWTDAAPLWATLRPSTRAESPHVFQRDGKWWLFHTVNTPGADDTVHVLSNAFSPADTVTSHWSQPIGLQYVVPPAEAGAYNRWHATEYLEINAAQDIRYLAAFNDLTTGISYTQMRAASPPYLFTGECPTSVGVNESVGGGRTTLLLLGANPTRSGARFRISSIEPAPRLHVYDVRGHRVRTLQSTSVGSDLYESAWDGRDDRGLAVAAGIYFARVGLENASDIRIVLLK